MFISAAIINLRVAKHKRGLLTCSNIQFSIMNNTTMFISLVIKSKFTSGSLIS